MPHRLAYSTMGATQPSSKAGRPAEAFSSSAVPPPRRHLDSLILGPWLALGTAAGFLKAAENSLCIPTATAAFAAGAPRPGGDTWADYPCQSFPGAKILFMLQRVFSVWSMVLPGDGWIMWPIGFVALWLLYATLLPARWYTWRARALLTFAALNSRAVAVACFLLVPQPYHMQSYWATFLGAEFLGHAWFAYGVPLSFWHQLAVSSLQLASALAGGVLLAGHPGFPHLLPTVMCYGYSSAFSVWTAYHNNLRHPFAGGAALAPAPPPLGAQWTLPIRRAQLGLPLSASSSPMLPGGAGGGCGSPKQAEGDVCRRDSGTAACVAASPRAPTPPLASLAAMLVAWVTRQRVAAGIATRRVSSHSSVGQSSASRFAAPGPPPAGPPPSAPPPAPSRRARRSPSYSALLSTVVEVNGDEWESELEAAWAVCRQGTARTAVPPPREAASEFPEAVLTSLAAAQRVVASHAQLYVSSVRRTRMQCKISGFEPHHLPAGLPRRLAGAVSTAGGGQVIGVAIRCSCIELCVDAVMARGGRRGPAAAVAAATLGALGLSWADQTTLTVFCNNQACHLIYAAASQSWCVAGGSSGGRGDGKGGSGDAVWGDEHVLVRPALWHVRPWCADLPSSGNSLTGSLSGSRSSSSSSGGVSSSGSSSSSINSTSSGGGVSSSSSSSAVVGSSCSSSSTALRLTVTCTKAWGAPKAVEDLTVVATAGGRFFEVRLCPEAEGAAGDGSLRAACAFRAAEWDVQQAVEVGRAADQDLEVSSSYDSSCSSLAAEGGLQVLQVEVVGCGQVAGLLRLELLYKGRPLGSRDVLLVPDAAVAREVAELEEELQAALEIGDADGMQMCEDVTHDVGLLIALMAQVRGLLTAAAAAPPPPPPPQCPGAEVELGTLVGSHGAGVELPPPSAAYVADMVEVAYCLLPFCCQRGWTHTMEHLVDGVALLLAWGGGEGGAAGGGAAAEEVHGAALWL